MWRIYFFNFDYYHQDIFSTLEEAKSVGDKTGFQYRIDWCPKDRWEAEMELDTQHP